jgi:ureidoglycolate dehydrogenase (NAD+)
MLLLACERARGLCLASLAELGLARDQAEIVADCALFASLRGLDTHGVIFVLPQVVDCLHRGAMLRDAQVGTIRESATTAVLKGNGAPGAVVGVRAMDLAIAKAKSHGLGAVTAFNSHHFGAASYYPVRALAHGMVGLTMCNAGANVVPYGGLRPLHGTNPIAYAVPAGEEPPIVLDIATSAAAAGQIAKAARHGHSIPLGWALDPEGRPTTDPAVAKLLLPFGGHKGYGLGLLVDVLTAALAGSEIGRLVDQRNITAEAGGQSLLMLAVNVGHFVQLETFTSRVDELIRDAHATPPAEGFAKVLVPGDLERQQEEARRREGIPLFPEDWQAIVDGLARAGLPAAELAARFGPEET